MCRRVELFIKELIVFVAELYVPSDNNAAERSLWHLVVSRKISGGTRSARGTDRPSTPLSKCGLLFEVKGAMRCLGALFKSSSP